MRKLALVALLAGLVGLVFGPSAVAGASSGAVKISDVEVKGEALHRKDLPVTVNIIGSQEFERELLWRTEDILLEVPGVQIGNYNQGGVANVIRMRGFTKGAHGGDLAIYIDGIPLNEGESHADGYADMNVIIPLEVEKLEVYKGPASALYGNFARAGILAFYTRKKGTYNKFKLSYGSFGTLDAQGAFGMGLAKDLWANLAFQGARTDGYQDNSAWRRINASARLTYAPSERLELAVSARAHDSDWDAPGYIPKWMFDAGSTSQAPNAENDGGKKKFFSERVDVGYKLGQGAKLLVWAYSTQQDFTRYAKFGYTPGGQTERYYDRFVWGTGTSLNLERQLAGKNLSAVVGMEYYHEDTKWKRWNTSNRVRIAQTQDRDFVITTASAFFQGEWELAPWFRPTLGLRYDSFGGSYENRDPGSQPFNRDMESFSHLSPKLGVRSRLFKGLELRASWCEGFALPKGEAKYQPGLNVNPETIDQYEIGITYDTGGKIWADLAAFILDSDGEIQEDPPGSGTYKNVGKTRRKGLELNVKAWPLKGLEIAFAGALIDTEVLENATSSLVGKEVPGVAEHLFTLSARYTHPSGVGCFARWRQVGPYYIDSANTLRYDGYNTVDTGVSYSWEHKGMQAKITLEVQNLLDEHYTQAVWSGYGTTNYAVSWPRTVWVMINLAW